MGDSELLDPLGRLITLHDRTWSGHILKGHPEVKNFRALVEQTIRNSDEIRFRRSDPNCRLYYGPGPDPAHRMLVVADIAGRLVKTAHLARRISGGPMEWSK
jgi:hypothetical protein